MSPPPCVTGGATPCPVLASFTLIAVQWMYLYVPLVYKSTATVLLTLRIYDPKILNKRKRKPQYELRYRRPKKKGLTSKFFCNFPSKKDTVSRQKAVQKRDDANAADKLKQLYTALGCSPMSSTGT